MYYTVDWFQCVQVTSHFKCIMLVSVRSSLPCIGVRIELTFILYYELRSCMSLCFSFSPKTLTRWIFAQIICAGTQGVVIHTKEVYLYPCY